MSVSAPPDPGASTVTREKAQARKGKHPSAKTTRRHKTSHMTIRFRRGGERATDEACWRSDRTSRPARRPGPLRRAVVPSDRGRANDYDIRVVKTKGEFTRHRHPKTDEVFLVLSGSLTIRLDDDEVTLGPGQLYVVPKGVHHQPVSVDGADVVVIEPSTTINTGDNPSHLTAERRLD